MRFGTTSFLEDVLDREGHGRREDSRTEAPFDMEIILNR
jgi:hypothetical protein